jgi:hypothetical protein
MLYSGLPNTKKNKGHLILEMNISPVMQAQFSMHLKSIIHEAGCKINYFYLQNHSQYYSDDRLQVQGY